MRSMSRPTITMLMLGRKLRELRASANLSQAKAAKASRFSETKLSDIENGKRGISLYDIAGLCRLYGASNDLEDELVRMSDKLEEAGWWEPYTTSMLKDFSMFLELEQISRAIQSYEAELIHGLLQTKEYATAIHDADPLMSGEQASQAVTLRIKRQERYWTRSIRRNVCLIMHESAIARPVLSRAGMSEQKTRLLEVAKHDGVEILVLPASAGAHPSMKGPYQLMESSQTEIPDTVYVESVDGCRYEESDSCLTLYRRLFEETRRLAIPVKEFL